MVLILEFVKCLVRFFSVQTFPNLFDLYVEYAFYENARIDAKKKA